MCAVSVSVHACMCIVELCGDGGKGYALLKRDRFNHKSDGLIHTGPRSLCVCVLKHTSHLELDLDFHQSLVLPSTLILMHCTETRQREQVRGGERLL